MPVQASKSLLALQKIIVSCECIHSGVPRLQNLAKSWVKPKQWTFAEIGNASINFIRRISETVAEIPPCAANGSSDPDPDYYGFDLYIEREIPRTIKGEQHGLMMELCALSALPPQVTFPPSQR